MDAAAAGEDRLVSAGPHIALLYCADCPSHPAALQQLKNLMEEAGLDPATIELRLLVTPEEAVTEKFIGSPTIRIDGIDVVDPGSEPPRLSCRVYRHRDGRYSPLPEDDDIRRALRGSEGSLLF